MVAEVKLPEIYSPLIGSTSKGPNNFPDIIIWNESNYKLEDKKVLPASPRESSRLAVRKFEQSERW